MLSEAEHAFFATIKHGETLGVAAHTAMNIESTFDLGNEFSSMLDAQLLSLPIRTE